MEKMKIGIPRGLYYYFFGELYQSFFKKLKVPILISPCTNEEILKRGTMLAMDEMCLPMKIVLGHTDYLKDKCDWVLLPRVDNYGLSNQTCTNFLALYDIVSNLLDVPLLNYNIDEHMRQDELDGFLKIGRDLGFSDMKILNAYEESVYEIEEKKRKKYIQNYHNLSKNTIKILIVSHPYNTYDEMIGKPVITFLQKLGVTIIYSDQFDPMVTEKKSKKISVDLYWKYSKEALGSIPLSQNKIDGIIFLSSFPCALDSIAYELAMRKVTKPYIHLVIDDLNSLTGIETRLESFVDILEEQKSKQ